MQKSDNGAMLIRDQGENYLESIIDTDKYTSIGIGPGIDQKKQTHGFPIMKIRKHYSIHFLLLLQNYLVFVQDF